MSDLELVLRQLADGIEFPPTPRFAPVVLDRIQAGRRARVRRLRAVALTTAAFLVSAGAVLAAVPAARDAVLEVFRLGNAVSVERVARLPSIPGSQGLRPGRPTTLGEARRLVSFDVLVPEALGPPDEVYVSSFVPDGEVNLLYRPRPGLPAARETGAGVLLNEFANHRFGREMIRKLVAEAGTIERLRVGDHPALWVTGPHSLIYARQPRSAADARLAANVLLVELEDTIVRIESRLSKRESLRIAESLSAP